MAGNINNLRKPTPEQAREYGRKGGLASVEAKRKLKDAKAAISLLMEMPLSKHYKDDLVNNGIEVPKDATMSYWMQWYPMLKALKKGDTKAIELMNKYVMGFQDEELRKIKEENKLLKEQTKKLKAETELLKQTQDEGIEIEDSQNLAKMLELEESNDHEEKDKDDSTSNTTN